MSEKHDHFHFLRAKKADDKKYVYKFSKDVLSKLYDIDNSKTRGQSVNV